MVLLRKTQDPRKIPKSTCGGDEQLATSPPHALVSRTTRLYYITGIGWGSELGNGEIVAPVENSTIVLKSKQSSYCQAILISDERSARGHDPPVAPG